MITRTTIAKTRASLPATSVQVAFTRLLPHVFCRLHRQDGRQKNSFIDCGKGENLATDISLCAGTRPIAASQQTYADTRRTPAPMQPHALRLDGSWGHASELAIETLWVRVHCPRWGLPAIRRHATRYVSTADVSLSGTMRLLDVFAHVRGCRVPRLRAVIARRAGGQRRRAGERTSAGRRVP